MPSTTVFCGNLPLGIKSTQILDLFEPFGEVKDHNIVKSYAFIEFEHLEEAEKAVKALSQTKFEDKTLIVEISRKRENGSSGAGSKRGSDRDRDRRDRDNRRDRDKRGRGSGPENRIGGPPPSVQIPGMMPGLDPMAVLGALTGQLPMQPPPVNVGRDIGPGPTPLNDAVVIYERFFVDPNHPLLKGLPLPRIGR